MPKIAVLIPCYNEEKTVAQVVRDFRNELPEAQIYVYDNNSSDKTAELAAAAGAVVRKEWRQGKGYVMRSMFKEVDADVYVMVDGDGTYPPHRVHDLIAPVMAGEADMVNGSRLHEGSDSSFRQLNLMGNRIFIGILNFVFQVRLTDLLSGYRAFNLRVVKGLPLLSRGFEIETELTMKAIERDLRITEIPVDLTDRPEGSSSKIKIAKDGFLILYTLFSLFRDYKPFTLFGSIGILVAAAGFVPGIVVVREFLLTGYIERVPSAILAVGLVLSGLLILLVGLVLHAIARRFQEHDRQMQNIIEALHITSRD
jgi:glycosyltransferase involved in cell wall biosynthesis